MKLKKVSCMKTNNASRIDRNEMEVRMKNKLLMDMGHRGKEINK